MVMAKSRPSRAPNPNRRGAVLGALLALALSSGRAMAADSCSWLGEELPLPLPVETPDDIAFKTAAERQYLIFNLLAGGKMAWQRGDYLTAVRKWEALLRAPGLDRQTEKAVAPFLADARERLVGAAPGDNPMPPSGILLGPTAGTRANDVSQASNDGKPGDGVAGRPTVGTVSGTVSGGGQLGPGSAVIWLRRIDAPMPRAMPVKTSITQRDKTFIPHVLVVPTGSTVEFRNEDRIYHNVFSLARPNDFDAGVRATGSTYTRKFDRAGVVDVLCNIHATMSAYIYVVDSPFFAKARPTGAFTIAGVPPGRYEVFAWHEASSAIAHKEISVSGSRTRITLTIGGDKSNGLFVPDKYGHKRQPHLGY
jgi:plastocyanin